MKQNRVSREEGAKAQEALTSLSVASPQAPSQHLWALSVGASTHIAKTFRVVQRRLRGFAPDLRIGSVFSL